VEGESAAPEDCSQVGKCSVRDLPAGLAGQTPIEVEFRYRENGRLTVRVRIRDADMQLRHEIQRDNSMSPQELDRWRKRVLSASFEEPGSDGSSVESR
jgi:hypothetical protein